MRRKHSFSEKVVALSQKFLRFTKGQKTFILYLAILTFSLLLFPIISIDAIWEWSGSSIWLLSGTFFKTSLFIFSILAILIWRNTSFRFKNLMIRYFGFRNDDNLINFFLLRSMSIVFIGVTESITLTNVLSTGIKLTGFAIFIEIILLIGLLLNLWFVLKSAQINGKKAKIITTQDHDLNGHTHELKESEKQQLKGLFSK